MSDYFTDMERSLELARITLRQISEHSKDPESRFRAKRALGVETKVTPALRTSHGISLRMEAFTPEVTAPKEPHGSPVHFQEASLRHI